MTLTVPPMPKNTENIKPVREWVADLIAWGKQGWDEAERLETEKESHEDAHWYEVGQNNALRSQLDACYTALGTTFYMDPPDGGDPGIAVMVGRMKAHRDELITQVRELAEALENASLYFTQIIPITTKGYRPHRLAKQGHEVTRAALSRLASAGSK